MAEFEIIEADFQQFYGICLEDELKRGFRRCARLIVNLPQESRFFIKCSPFKEWGWDDEVKSQILYRLDIISCQIANMGKKKGQKPSRPGKQFQPDYVEKAKKDMLKKKKEKNAEKLDEISSFWESRNGRS